MKPIFRLLCSISISCGLWISAVHAQEMQAHPFLKKPAAPQVQDATPATKASQLFLESKQGTHNAGKQEHIKSNLESTLSQDLSCGLQTSTSSRHTVNLGYLPGDAFQPSQYQLLHSFNGFQFPTSEALTQFLKVQFGHELKQEQIELILKHSTYFEETQQPLLPQLSAIETDLQPKTAASEPTDSRVTLCQFAYDYLNSDKFTYAPISHLAAPTNYIVGPGDEVMVYNGIPNKNESRSFVIDAQGLLNIPGMEPIKAWNVTLDELQSTLKERSRFTHISLTKLRSIQINLIGEVNRPGLHQIPATASPYDILAFAGGVKKSGSLRHIKWLRHEKELGEIDLYEYFLSGTMTNIHQVRSGDTLLIPVIKNVVAISGEVRRPGIYELHSETTLDEVVNRMAGGILPTADTDRILVERINEQQQRTIQSLSLLSSEQQSSDTLQNYDIITVHKISPIQGNHFELAGPFSYPGSYELLPDMSLREALLIGGPLTQEVSIARGQIKRLDYTNLTYAPEETIINFNYFDVIHQVSPQELKLKNGDVITLFLEDKIVEQSVSIYGDILHSPGSFPFSEGMNLSALVALAHGLQHNNLDSTVFLHRWVHQNGTLKRQRYKILVDPQTLQTDPPVQVEKGDTFFLRQDRNYKAPMFASIGGEVYYPGVYEFHEGERVQDLIERAGGFRQKAFVQGAIFTRASLKDKEEQVDERIERDVRRSLVQASVESSAKLGGSRQGANFGLLAAVKSMKEDTEDDLSTEQKMLLFSQLQNSSSASFTERTPLSLEEQNDLVTKSDLQKSNIGRLIVNIPKDLENFEDSSSNIELQHGDHLYVPTYTPSILVKGEVFGEASLPLEPLATAYYYLEILGGPRQLASLEEVYILKANGLIVQSDLDSYALEAGDTIVVPPDLTPRESPLITAASYTQIIQTLLVSITLIVLLL